MTEDGSELNAIELATELTIAWLNNGNNRVAAEDVPAFLQTMHATVLGLASGASEPEEAAPQQDHVPAVSVRKSLASKDHIISMIDGKSYKTLRRHLAGHGLTPETYRERYGLRADYPMVAETYSQSRRDMAKRIGLGRKARTTEATTDVADDAGDAPRRRGRKPKAAE
ncbi:MucR family transcriptional regulator [Sphingomonas sp. 2R-10]|uniref:MucR family transcriptional regulator n=1 Tax=Sphingomonas sp. 2R-10 TaxID=3045148 RepID=UPI000F796889|nr:MucR family transcriptional regulator [Sphingomonas sp. 2R-10]MDJ0275278.1 MucR family transcriptional regulator [Sphingomonas sp. 2R-10]